MLFDLVLDPLDIHLRFGARHLALRKLRPLAAGEQRLCDFAPVAVHHVRLVELDLEEERRAGGVRRPAFRGGASIRGPDGRAYDEALERLAVPRAAAADLFRERLDVLHGWELERRGGDEAPFARERLDDGSWLRPEVPRTFVDAVQVQAGLFGGVREDVLLESVVAELRVGEGRCGLGVGVGRRTSAATVQFFAHRVSASCSVVFPARSR